MRQSEKSHWRKVRHFKKSQWRRGGAGGAARGGPLWCLRHCATAPVPFRGTAQKWRSKGLLAGALLPHKLLDGALAPHRRNCSSRAAVCLFCKRRGPLVQPSRRQRLPAISPVLTVNETVARKAVHDRCVQHG